MQVNGRWCDKTRKSNTIRYSLDQRARRSQSRRGNHRSTVIVYNYADDKVDDGWDDLADQKRTGEVSRITHFCSNSEIGGCRRAGKNKRWDCRYAICKRWIIGDLVVWNPSLRHGRWSVLHTNTNCYNENFKTAFQMLVNIQMIKHIRNIIIWALNLTSC